MCDSTSSSFLHSSVSCPLSTVRQQRWSCAVSAFSVRMASQPNPCPHSCPVVFVPFSTNCRGQWLWPSPTKALLEIHKFKGQHVLFS